MCQKTGINILCRTLLFIWIGGVWWWLVPCVAWGLTYGCYNYLLLAAGTYVYLATCATEAVATASL